MEVMTANMGWCFGIERAYQLIHDKDLEVGDSPVFAAHRSPPADLDTLHRIEARDQRLFEGTG